MFYLRMLDKNNTVPTTRGLLLTIFINLFTVYFVWNLIKERYEMKSDNLVTSEVADLEPRLKCAESIIKDRC